MADVHPGKLAEKSAARKERHAFALKVPPTFRAVPLAAAPPDGMVTQRLALYADSASDSAIEVRALKLSREVDPIDLLALHLTSEGATVIERVDMKSPSGRTGELLVDRRIDGGACRTRARAEKDGEFIYFVFAHAGASAYESQASMLREATQSFRLLHPEPAMAEMLLPAGARFPIDHSFLFPSSLRLRESPPENPAIAARELSDKTFGLMGGLITVTALARRPTDHEDPGRIAAWAARALDRRGVAPGSITLGEGEPLSGNLPTSSATTVGRLRDGETDIEAEVEIHVARHDHAWMVLTRATPHRSVHGGAWLASRRAFTIVRERLKVESVEP